MSDPCDWRTLFAAAMLEGDSMKVPLGVLKAEDAIQTRLRELQQNVIVGSEDPRLLSTASLE